MLRITADIFSGRPDPVSDITDENEVRALLREVDSNRNLFLGDAPADGGLGVRGFWLEPLNDEFGGDFGTDPRLYLPVGTQARRHAGTQARRHAGTQARRHAGTQARRPAVAARPKSASDSSL
ncbi:hypothetical protein [Streptomyces spinosirectus]